MRKLLLPLMLLSAALLLPPRSSAQFIVTGQGCGASGLSGIANDGTPVVCRGNISGALVWTAVGGSSSSGSGGVQGPIAVNAASLGVKAGWKKVVDASWTTSSPQVTLGASDPIFTSADNGDGCWGVQAAHVLELGSSTTGGAFTTLTVVDSTHANCGAVNAGSTTSGGGTFYWGPIDSTTAWPAVTAALAALPKNSLVNLVLPCGMTDVASNVTFSAITSGSFFVSGCSDGTPTIVLVPPNYNFSGSAENGIPFGASGTGQLNGMSNVTFDYGSNAFTGKTAVGGNGFINIVNNTSVNAFNLLAGLRNVTMCCGLDSISMSSMPLIAVTGGTLNIQNLFTYGVGPTGGVALFTFVGQINISGSNLSGNISNFFNPNTGQVISSGNTYNSNLAASFMYNDIGGTNDKFQSVNDIYSGTEKLLFANGGSFWISNLRHIGSFTGTGIQFASGSTSIVKLNQVDYSGISVAAATTGVIFQDASTTNAGTTTNSGTLTVHHTETGTCTFAASTTCAVTFAQPFGSGTPVVTLTPINPGAVTFSVNANPTQSGFTITASASNSLAVQWSGTL